MPTEIERKFLVLNDTWQKFASKGVKYLQGYFATHPRCSIRIRIEGDRAALNIKSATLGITRSEYNYPIPVDDAREILDTLCEKPLISKTRYHVRQNDQLWEIDVFEDDNEGLVVAELELTSTSSQFVKPDWVGEEVSDDPKYYNVCLVQNPYKNWK